MRINHLKVKNMYEAKSHSPMGKISFLNDISHGLGLTDANGVPHKNSAGNSVIANRKLRPEQFSIQELAEAIVGPAWRTYFDPGSNLMSRHTSSRAVVEQRFPGQTQALFESTGTGIDPTAFANINAFSAVVGGLIEVKILEAFALTLQLPTNFFRERYKRPLVRARLLHYPHQEPSHSDEQFGAAEHTDYGAITILWQDEVGGLQVKNRSGQWMDAAPIANTFVINIGDMLERWSNHLFVSTPHRVINRSGRERYSIPVFYDPDYDAVISCLPHCASAENPEQYPPIVSGDYITARYDGTYAYRQEKKESQQ